jgi:hypothetical protein
MTALPFFDPWAELARIRANQAKLSPVSPASAEPTPPANPPDHRGTQETFATFATFAAPVAKVRGSAPVTDWTEDDWRTHFEERLAVAMIDGEQPEAEARRIAYECCVVRWLDLHSVTSAPDRCAWCGKVDKPGNILPFGAAPAGHVWLHAGCWPHWSSQRREQAAVALAKLGITR